MQVAADEGGVEAAGLLGLEGAVQEALTCPCDDERPCLFAWLATGGHHAVHATAGSRCR